jgi:hypothetical protein
MRTGRRQKKRPTTPRNHFRFFKAFCHFCGGVFEHGLLDVSVFNTVSQYGVDDPYNEMRGCNRRFLFSSSFPNTSEMRADAILASAIGPCALTQNAFGIFVPLQRPRCLFYAGTFVVSRSPSNP